MPLHREREVIAHRAGYRRHAEGMIGQLLDSATGRKVQLTTQVRRMAPGVCMLVALEPTVVLDAGRIDADVVVRRRHRCRPQHYLAVQRNGRPGEDLVLVVTEMDLVDLTITFEGGDPELGLTDAAAVPRRC